MAIQLLEKAFVFADLRVAENLIRAEELPLKAENS